MNTPIFRLLAIAFYFVLSDGHAQSLLEVGSLDSSVRHYTFERISDVVPDLTGQDSTGLVITHASPYHDDVLQGEVAIDFPKWTEGRWQGKPALTFRSTGNSVMESLFFRTDTDALVVESWVRIHSPQEGDRGRANLFSVGNGFRSGWAISADEAGVYARLGRSQELGGDVNLVAPPLVMNVWHHLVMVLDGQTLRLYCDGELAGEQKFEGAYSQPEPPRGRTALHPEESREGLKIGAQAYRNNTLFFDLDELAIYDSPLSADEIRAHYEQGRPALGPAQQAVRHLAFLTEKSLRDQIEIEIPRDSYGYFEAGSELPVTITLPNEIAEQSAHYVHTRLVRAGEETVLDTQLMMESGIRATTVLVSFPEVHDVYQLFVSISDDKDSLVAREVFPLGVTVPVAPMEERPASSPLGGHEIFTRHIEDLAIGGRIERHIPYLPKAKGTMLPNFDNHLDARVDKALKVGLDMMLTVGPFYDPPHVTPTEKPQWNHWLRAIVDRYKGRVKYWEILNEPNAHGMPPSDYVDVLVTAHDIIRELDPEAKIVGLCGVTTYPEWTEDVLAAGGAGYFDILSFHNYIGRAPVAEWQKYRKIERTKTILKEYLDEVPPLWNTECGIHQPRRIDGRPLTEEDLLARYPRARQLSDGVVIVSADAIALTTEAVGAAWQTQAILLDCALGVEKWFMLMGSSVFYPHPGGSAGAPSLKGIAYAALASVLTTQESVELIPLSVSTAAAVRVTDLDGSQTAALFANGPSSRSFIVAREGLYHGMDYLGNPLTWKSEGNILTINLGREPVYVFDITSEFREAPFLAFEEFPSLLSPGEQESGFVRVRNLLSEELNARLSLVSAGSEFSYDPTVKIPAGAEELIPFTLTAGALARGEHMVRASLDREETELASSELTFASEGVARGIPLVEYEIELDGDGAEWTSLAAEVADTADKVYIGRPPVGYYDPNSWQGPSDLSFAVKTAWRENDGIYFYIEVQDDHFKPVAEGDVHRAYLQDALEFFFDGRALAEQTPVYSPGVEQNAIVPVRSGELAPAHVQRFGRFDPIINIDAVGKQTEYGYVLEGRIRPTQEAAFQLQAGTRIGMDFVFDDAKVDEMTRRVQMALHGSSRNNLDSSEFGRYYLMGEGVHESKNLLLNPTLESNEEGRIEAWLFRNPSKNPDGNIQGGVTVEDGKTALWIESTHPDRGAGQWNQVMPVAGGAALEASFQMKGVLDGECKWAPGGAGVFFLDAKGKWLKWERIAQSEPTGEWGSYRLMFQAPEEAVAMGLRLTLSTKEVQGAVKFFYTDMQLHEVPSKN
ncbi:LamG-like jellyroll fold domain-containing protein [Coraliomargarita algicola]|uniref:LamG-like jellyroll fold domain-containing protein n=1 Tax=Coraliomargarita algicola TaxID=3092156 RepID=A0ABZ0RP09_9BACT|nr:LamG-like jellyroll fold domain-containing protein [Coraliomargarita sp. J2-16]WPJ96700.1 LamG-like jellyroll fold domain-containing protein [Coraliomargarita sp. J2-16]